MSDIPSFPYSLLWGERSIQSVANLTRADARAFLSLGAERPCANRNTILLDVERQRSLEPFALRPNPRRRRPGSELVERQSSVASVSCQ